MTYRPTTVALAVLLSIGALPILACATPLDDPFGESESAAEVVDKCSIDSIRKECIVSTPYVAIKNVNPLNGTTTGTGSPGSCTGFNCANFGGNFCRCAEKQCPGGVGKTIFQQNVRCTAYYNCDHVSVRHVVNILCEPVPGDPTKKTCKCIEPQPDDDGKYNTIYGEGVLGANETPSDTFCQNVVCDSFLVKDWRACPGGKTRTTCDNVNGKDSCPQDCCVRADGSVPTWCGECNPGTLPKCDAPKPKIPVAVAVPIDAPPAK